MKMKNGITKFGIFGFLGLWTMQAQGGDFNLSHEHVPGQLIVKFKSATKSLDSKSLLNAMGAQASHTFSNGAVTIQMPLAKNSSKADADKALANFAQTLAADPSVEYVEANTIMRTSNVPNDPKLGELWGMRNTGLNSGVAGVDIKAVEAWDIATGSKNVIVGIIDTGVDYNNPDIAPNYWKNPGEVGFDAQGRDKTTNAVDDDGNGFVDDFRGWNFAGNNNNPMDDNKHGTHCAGTIGGHGNNGVGVVGVSWNVSMVGLKFLDGSGSGTLENAVKAIEYGTKLGVHLTSNSWGGGGFSQTMSDAIKAAGTKGILFVAAAGNDSANNDTNPHYPSSYTLGNIISVAASDNRDALASFSNRGLRTVHLAAPGKDIISSVPGGTFESLSGTSMATPHVSGAVALVKSHFPELTMTQIKDRIVGTVDVTTAATGTTISGGRLNILNALEVDSVAPGAVAELGADAASLSAFRVGFAPAGDDGNVGLATRYQVRTSPAAILTLAQWDGAQVVTPSVVSQDATRIILEIGGMSLNGAGFVAVRAVDNVGNMGPVSTSVAYAVRRVQIVAENPAESLSDVTAGTWGLETLADGSHAFSDSVAGQYANSANSILTVNPIVAASSDLLLGFAVKHNVESGYDFCRIEITKDTGATWTELVKYTGSSDWKLETLPLAGVAAGGSFQIRFKLTSDSSIQGDGCLFDNLKVFAPVP